MTRGTILKQGSVDCIEAWKQEHFPQLLTYYRHSGATVQSNPVTNMPPNTQVDEAAQGINATDRRGEPREEPMETETALAAQDSNPPTSVPSITASGGGEQMVPQSPASPTSAPVIKLAPPPGTESNGNSLGIKEDPTKQTHIETSVPVPCASGLAGSSDNSVAAISVTKIDNEVCINNALMFDANNPDKTDNNPKDQQQPQHQIDTKKKTYDVNNSVKQQLEKPAPEVLNSPKKKTINSNALQQSINMNNQQITNNRIFLENMEKEFIRRMTAYETRYEQLYQEIIDHRATISELQIEKSRMEKTIKTLVENGKKETLTEELKRRHEEESKLLQTEIDEQKLEITRLRLLISHQDAVHTCKEELYATITDNETRCKNRFKEEKQSRTAEKDNVQLKINELELSVNKVKETVQRELNKNVPSTRPIPSSRPTPPNLNHDTVLRSNSPPGEASCAAAPMSNPSSTIKNPETVRRREDVSPNELSATDDEEDSGEQTIINSEVVILMDSNRRFIASNDVWGDSKTRKLRVGTAAELIDTLQRYKFPNVQHLIISTGTNDTDNHEVDEIAFDIINGAKLAQQLYKNAHIYVSQLLPRRDYCHVETRLINERIELMLPKSIHVIKHTNITSRNMYDDKHVRRTDVHLITTNITNKMLQVTNLNFIPNPHSQHSNQQFSNSHPYNQRNSNSYDHDPYNSQQRRGPKTNRPYNNQPSSRDTHNNRRNDNRPNKNPKFQPMDAVTAPFLENTPHHGHQQTTATSENQNMMMEKMFTMLEESNRKMLENSSKILLDNMKKFSAGN